MGGRAEATGARSATRSSSATSSAIGERAQGARRAQGHAGGDLHGDGPGAARGDARVHASRRAAHGRLRRLLGRLAVGPHERHGLRGARHAGRGVAPRRPVPLKRTADEAMAAAPGVTRCLVVRRTGGDVEMREGRDVWFHELDVSDDPATCPCEPMDAEDLLFLMYTSGTTAKPKGIAHTTGGYLVGVATTHHYIFDLKPERDVYWCAADIGWITGHSLHRLRAALQRRHVGALRGHARLPGQGPLVGRDRALRRDDPLHGADRDPRAHEMGPGARGEARPLVAAAARLGRRADQPRGVDLVPRAHRRRALPDRRHLVADRDGDDPDHAAARDHDDEARLGDEAVPGRRRRRRQRAGREGRAGRRLPRARPAVAGDDARHLRRRRTLPRDVLGALPGPLLRR